MRIIPKKNYALFALLIAVTILATLYFSDSYRSKTKEVSNVYSNSSVITYKDFDVYVTENPDSIIYIGNKYDLNYNEFDSKLIQTIEQLNLNDNFVYMNANNKIINKINREYKIKLSISNIPYLIVLIDGNIYEYKEIKNDSDASSIINYGVFE